MVSVLRSLSVAAGLALGLLASGPATAASCASSGLGFSGPTVDGSGSFATSGLACYDFTATVTQGAFVGSTGMGYFTFDAGRLPASGSSAGDGNLFTGTLAPSFFPSYGFGLDIFGQTFVGGDTEISQLNVDNYGPLAWAAVFNDAVIDDPLIISMESIINAGERRNLFASGTPGTFDVNLRVAAIPLPAGVWLLMGGLLGLGVLTRRRRTAA